MAEAARKADYSWNDWAELVLAAAASPAAAAMSLRVKTPEGAVEPVFRSAVKRPDGKVEAELSPHFQALAQAAAEKPTRKRSKRPELSRLELTRAAEARLADRLSSQMELP